MELYKVRQEACLVNWRAKGYEWSTRKVLDVGDTLSHNDGRDVRGNTTAGGFAIQLPVQPQNYDGEEWRIVKSRDANPLTILPPAGGTTINGQAMLILTAPGEVVQIRYDLPDDNFVIVGGYQ